MKHLKIGIVAIVTVVLGLGSCIEHEIIPAPVPMVELNCHFIGSINSTNVELTENVLGYYCNTSQDKFILAPPAFSSVVYYSEMLSAQTPVSIKIGIGSAMWDASTTSDPTLTLFNSFHFNNPTPNYSNNGTSGFEVTYKDGVGNTWVSDENSVNFQDVSFSSIVQESDSTGDYSKFICDFECYVYRTDPITSNLDSVHIQAAEFQGWFKR